MTIQETLAEGVRQHRFFDDGQGDQYEVDRAQLVITIFTQFIGDSVYSKYNADDLRALLRACHFSKETINMVVCDDDQPWGIY